MNELENLEKQKAAKKASLKKLEEFIEEQHNEINNKLLEGRLQKLEQHKPDSEEIRTAEKIKNELMANDIMPVVTVLKEHAEEVKKEGLTARPTAASGRLLIAATLGREPFRIEDKDRVAFRVKIDDPDKVATRWTGPTRTFEGIVGLNEYSIPPEQLEEIDPSTIESIRIKSFKPKKNTRLN